MKKAKNQLFYLSIMMFSFISCKTEIKLKIEPLENSKIIAIDSLVNRYLELGRFSGAVLVLKENLTIYRNNFGLADYENAKSFTDKTAFKIGEITELFTANIIREFIKEGKLQVSDTISKYFPEIERDITIKNLLNHTDNLPSIKKIQEQNPELKYTTLEFAKLASQTKEISKNSDLGYNILGLLIEKISEVSFQRNIEKYSEILKLENTYFQKKDTCLAVGYLYHNFRAKGMELQKAPVSNLDITCSSKGLKSTINDLAKLLINSPNKEVQFKGYLQNDGFSYSILNDPSTKISLLILSNRRHPVATEISNSIQAILQNKEYRLPLARKPYDIDKSLLKNYAGNYSLNEDVNFEVINEKDSLYVLFGPNKIHLVAQSANQFYMEQGDASMRFLKDSTKLINEVVLLNGFLDGDKAKRIVK